MAGPKPTPTEEQPDLEAPRIGFEWLPRDELRPALDQIEVQRVAQFLNAARSVAAGVATVLDLHEEDYARRNSDEPKYLADNHLFALHAMADVALDYLRDESERVSDLLRSMDARAPR
ncbi:MAG: hypothetical protein MUF30_11660 [Burkholderiales bacterium]|jgi:hypothetical protein|nr:hypothetical protein [Burkholderiales bacterium]